MIRLKVLDYGMEQSRKEGIAEGEIKGEIKGRKEGEIKGRKEGEIKGEIKTLYQRLKLTPEQIAQERHMSVEEVNLIIKGSNL